MKPHKHAEFIKAWADGAEIQFKGPTGWEDKLYPSWFENTEYRIKPAEKVVRWLWARKDNGKWYSSAVYMTQQEAKDSFTENGITEYKKLEWSREEFDE